MAVDETGVDEPDINQKNLCNHTVKTFGLLQPYFGGLSCMPERCVCDTLQTSRKATNLILNQSVVEKLLPLLN